MAISARSDLPRETPRVVSGQQPLFARLLVISRRRKGDPLTRQWRHGKRVWFVQSGGV